MPVSQVKHVDRVLTPASVAFIEDLTRRFRPRIEELLARRCAAQQRYDRGERPDFLAETADIRNREWTVAPLPDDLQDRRVSERHDGTWVAHPGLVSVAMEVFNDGMPSPNQIDRKRDEVVADAKKLVEPPRGTRTDAGLRHNIRVGIQYLEAWLGGQGAVPIYNLMEDAATAEISRTQIWQWLTHRATLDDGRVVTRELVAKRVDDEYARVRGRGRRRALRSRPFSRGAPPVRAGGHLG
jgi:malate synthase